MLKVNFENKQLNDGNKSIESITFYDFELKPVTYFVVRWTKTKPPTMNMYTYVRHVRKNSIGKAFLVSIHKVSLRLLT